MKHRERIEKRRPREQLFRKAFCASYRNGHASRPHTHAQSIPRTRKRCRPTRNHQTQRLHHTRHRRSSPHNHTRPRRTAKRLGHTFDLLLAQFTSAKLRPIAATISTRTQSLTMPGTGSHRARHHLNSGNISRSSRHQLRRHSLIATPHQHHRIHRLRRNQFLGLHRQQIPKKHRRRRKENLIQRNRGKHKRQATTFKNPAFNRLDQIRHMPVAGIVIRSRRSNTNNGTIHILAIISRSSEKRPANILAKFRIAVAGQIPIDTGVCRLGHDVTAFSACSAESSIPLTISQAN